MRLIDLPPRDRPRERAARRGVGALSDLELLAAILGSGGSKADALELAGRVLSLGLETLSGATVGELSRIPGIGQGQAARLVAAFELARRVGSVEQGALLRTSRAIARAVRAHVGDQREEALVLVLLTARLRLLRLVDLGRGGPASAAIPLTAALATALREGAPRFALCHNHPGGDPAPSEADVVATRDLATAALAVGLELVDHVIVTRRAHFSFADRGLLLPARTRR